MVSNGYVESLVRSAKRLKISTPRTPTHRALHQKCIKPHVYAAPTAICRSSSALLTNQTTRSVSTTSKRDAEATDIKNVRLPKAVQAVFLAPLQRAPTHGIPVCDLQIRSYSVRNVEAFADFCMRAAYYLNLPAKGPIPLPRITERWTVPRSNFVHKKSQENFERRTLRRLIQIQDGHPETVAIWLAYIQKQRYYGVGVKANVFEHGKLDVVQDMEAEGKRLEHMLGEEWNLFGTLEKPSGSEDHNTALLEGPFKGQWGGYGPMAGIQKQATGRTRFQRYKLTARSSPSTPSSPNKPATPAAEPQSDSTTTEAGPAAS